MRIEGIELRVVEMPLVEPFETSFGREEVRPCIVIKAISNGLVGWGECVAGAGPWYSYETIETAWHVLHEFLIPAVLGRDLGEPEALTRDWRRVRGHPMAKAGLEAALWDLWAKSQNMSMRQALGGVKDRVESGISLGIQPSLDALFERIAEALERGYRRVKLKIKPGHDVSIVQAVRERFGDIPLMTDANAAYALDDLSTLTALDEYELMMIEQPFRYDDLVDHAELQRRLKTPVCLDESVKSPEGARQALELGSCRIFNIKPGRVGGLLSAERIHDLCVERDVPVWCGGMLETGIGRAHNVALASLPGFSLPNDLSASERYYHEDLVEPPFVLEPGGTLAVPEGPGIGVEVLENRLEHVTVRRTILTA
jgi:O-succinylbenzoate synthase